MFKKLYEKAKMGDAQAQYELGAAYEMGDLINQSDVNAIMWYIQAANQNLSVAQFKLGLLYMYGKGCPVDVELAKNWFAKAAEQGHKEAVTLLKEPSLLTAPVKVGKDQELSPKKPQPGYPAKRLDSLAAKEYQSLIIQILKVRPNQSCKKEDLTKHALKLLDVSLLGHLRDDFTRKINTALGVLKRQRIVEEYTSKNVRVRLIMVVPLQTELPFLNVLEEPLKSPRSLPEENQKMAGPTFEFEAVKVPTPSASPHLRLEPAPVAGLVIERIKKRMLDVLDYIKEAEHVGRKPPYRIAEYKRELFYQHELIDLPGITFNVGDGEAWMKVVRLKRDPPPEPPETLAQFIRLADDPRKQPELDEEEILRKLDDAESGITEEVAKAIFEAFQNYLHPSWELWAARELPRRRTINVYERLFAIQRTIYADNAADPIELVWGIGVTVWKHPQGIIQYPVLLQLVEIEIDPNTMSLTVRPRDKDPLIGLAPYFDLENDNAVQVKQAIGDFLSASEASISPFAADTYEGALRACAMLDSGAIYWPDREESRENPLPKAQDEMRITDTWAIFVRPKTAHFLEQDIEALKDRLKELVEIASGPKALFDDPASVRPVFDKIAYRGVSSPNPDRNGTELVKDLYFPKEFNKEQVEIIERLEQADGVVAQGPPGTGKTHTIANVICHYLATGKRILVTSKGEQALKVLKEKLPESLRPLAVSLLSNDKEALKEMEASVSAIFHKIQSVKPKDIEDEIARLKGRIDKTCAKIAEYENEIKDWARKQLTEIVFDGKRILPEALSRQLVQDFAAHTWFDDLLSSSSVRPSMSDDEVRAMSKCRIRIGNDLDLAGLTFPAMDRLPSIERIIEIHRDLLSCKDLDQDREQRGLLQDPERITEEKFALIEQLLPQLIELLNLSQAAPEERWLWKLWEDISKDARAGLSSETRRAIHIQVEGLSELEKERAGFVTNPVFLREDVIANRQFLDAVERCAKGVKPFGYLDAFSKADIKKALAEVTISGATPASAADWQHIERFAAFCADVKKSVVRWNALSAEFDGCEIQGDALSASKALHVMSHRVLFVFDLANNVWPKASQSLSLIFPGMEGKFQPETIGEALPKIIDSLRHILRRTRLAVAEGELAALRRYLNSFGAAPIQGLIEFVGSKIGNSGVSKEEIEKNWGALLDENRRIQNLKSDFDTVLMLAKKVKISGAPKWANRLLTVPATGSNDPFVPPHWRQSWEWKRFMTLLDEIDGQNRLRVLAGNLNQAEKDFRRANEQLVVEMTWRRLADMLPIHLASLKQYMIAIRKIGKGTGPKAAKYRREAREAMEVAVQAVPCWIMPHWRVSESLPATIGGFDLVILDEASQSNIMALPALLRAKKILIVGDDKQVSPVLVGKNTNTLLALEKKYLDSFQLGKQMRLESSVYQLAEVAFAMNNICLKQHFRCVEPIIQFSNHLCYRGELVPLRIPRPSERIDPPLVDVFVKDGYRHGSAKRNVPEAKAIVREIAHLVGDPAYRKKSIGVVTLLGQNDQSKVISDLLWKVIGEEKILEHDIVVGEPPNFQGNEKDIMFLSLVDDANSGAAKTMEMWEQRYNVAASRARDRMYLYHSFRREDVPNPEDLRRKILDYYQNPLVLDKKKVESWRELCESDFERAVYDALVARGYHVRPQVRAGNYRIDMVVEGFDDRRLAIECDGDAFHGPDRYYEDSVRQRMLERTGWTFWRCWGSSFYRDQEGKLKELYDKLTEMGIGPVGPEDTPPPEIVEFREVLGEPEEVAEEVSTDEFAIDEDAPEPELNQAEEPQKVFAEKTEAEVLEEGTAIRTADPLPPRWMPLTVEVGDTVVYCDVEKPEAPISIQILNSSTNVDYGIIGQNAPLAKALLGSEVGEEVSFSHPRGVRIYRILEIIKTEEPSRLMRR